MDSNNKNQLVNYFEFVFEDSDPWNYFNSEYELTKYKRQTWLAKQQFPNPRKILEIGCAEGAHTLMITDSFPDSEILGLDISQKAVDRAKLNLKDKKGITFAQGDLISYLDKIEDNSLDLVFWSESLYFFGSGMSLWELCKLFGKLANKIKTNGVLCSAHSYENDNASKMHWEPLMECYYQLISSFLEEKGKHNFEELKEEVGRFYSIRLYAKNKIVPFSGQTISIPHKNK